MNKKKNKGFTLIEILLVIGFISLASGSVYSLFSKVQEKRVAEKELNSLMQLKDAIEGFYAGYSNYTGLSAASLNAQNITPLSLRTTDPNQIANKDGPITFTLFSSWGVTNSGYRITARIDVASCPYVAMGLTKKFDAVQINYNNISGLSSGLEPADYVAELCADTYGLSYVELQLDTTRYDRRPSSSAVPPIAPSTRTQFTNTTSGLICDFEDAGYTYGSAAIPNNIRNQVIATYRGIDNHVGRCPNGSEYNPWIDRISAEKTASPGLTYQDIFTNIVEPEMVSSGTTSYTKASRISSADSECQTAATSRYGAFSSTARYVQSSGNKCRI